MSDVQKILKEGLLKQKEQRLLVEMFLKILHCYQDIRLCARSCKSNISQKLLVFLEIVVWIYGTIKIARSCQSNIFQKLLVFLKIVVWIYGTEDNKLNIDFTKKLLAMFWLKFLMNISPFLLSHKRLHQKL